ncbi:hypothetical protein [Caballeronia sp. S22]|uniref:hypothetical protein n=1 Tax=Caballeronia sp. S22 TaxID=3137182 RepID=UPI00353075D9
MDIENNLPPKAKMEFQEELLHLSETADGWATGLVGQCRERLMLQLARGGPDNPVTLALLTALHEAHEAMQAYRGHLLDTLGQIKQGTF